MGRRSHTRALSLWMNGSFVGTWSLQPHAGQALQYADSWTQAPEGRPLSLSLPFMPGNPPHRGETVRAYFENLLPDSQDIRDRVARRFQLGSTDAFALLAEIGRDCAGALQILPESMTPDDVQSVSAARLSDADVARLLRRTLAPAPIEGRDSADDDDFRISIAGAQEKTALLRLGDQWFRPSGATPTTHILKMPLGLVGNLQFDMHDSVENEWLCLEILRAYGLPVAHAQPVQFDDMKVLAVERFDRQWTDTTDRRWLVRIPQEDMCQALGVPPHLKYEADGGPGIAAIMQLLSTAQTPAHDRRVFFQSQVLFWMLRATDGHAKNFSIFLRRDGSYALTPLYDVLSAYPIIGKGANALSPYKAKMAMAVRTKSPHWRMHEIRRRHWLTAGKTYGIVTPDGRDAAAVVDDLIDRTPEVVRTVRARLPPGFPQRLTDTILGGVLAAAEQLVTTDAP